MSTIVLSSFAEYSGSGESAAASAGYGERKPQTRELNTAPEPYYGKVRRIFSQILQFELLSYAFDYVIPLVQCRLVHCIAHLDCMNLISC